MSADAKAAVGGILMPGFAGTELPGWVADRLRAGLASVCLYGPNIASSAQVRELTDAVRECNPDALIAVDEEGGDVTRLHYDVGSPSPGNAWLGRLDDVACTEQVGSAIASEMQAAGCNLNLAPCADVNSNADNPVIGVRSFGSDPGLAARHTAAWVRGHQSRGVAACVKHFPGHGDTSRDSHLDLPVVEATPEQLAARDLVPFVSAVESDVWAVMTSHILLPGLDPAGPATMSRAVLDGLLREELGFRGAVVSDALDMAGASRGIGIPEAAVRSLIGGCDLLCIGPDNTDDQIDEIERAVATAVEGGRLGADRLASARSRVQTLAERVRLVGRPPTPEQTAFSLDEVAAQFDVAASAKSAFEDGRSDTWSVVCLETTRNIAAGVAPWGPSAALAAGEASWPGELAVADSDTAADVLASQAGGVVMVGRANHRHGWVRQLADRRRALGPTVVVDMGWPSDDRAYADIATFGASRLLGAALLKLLGQQAGDGGRAR